MIPKAFLVDDLGNQLAQMQAELRVVRKKLDLTQKATEAQRKRLDALRKRVERSAHKEKLREEQRQHEPDAQEPLRH